MLTGCVSDTLRGNSLCSVRGGTFCTDVVPARIQRSESKYSGISANCEMIGKLDVKGSLLCLHSNHEWMSRAL